MILSNANIMQTGFHGNSSDGIARYLAGNKIILAWWRYNGKFFSGNQIVTAALKETAHVFHKIGDEHEESAKRDLDPLLDCLYSYKGLLAGMPDIVNVHKVIINFLLIYLIMASFSIAFFINEDDCLQTLQWIDV